VNERGLNNAAETDVSIEMRSRPCSYCDAILLCCFAGEWDVTVARRVSLTRNG
jgi:hypothetical protein